MSDFSEIDVIRSLEWLIYQFPKQDNPVNDADRLCNCVNLYCTNAIEVIKLQSATLDKCREVAIQTKNNLAELTGLYKQEKSELLDIFADTLKSLFCPGCEYFTIDICNAIDAVTKRLKEELEHKRETLSNTGGESE